MAALVPAALASGAAVGSPPVSLRFGLQLPRFTWPGGPEDRPRLRAIAVAAEEAGFERSG